MSQVSRLSDLVIVAITPASEVVVKNPQGDIIRIEPALKRLPAGIDKPPLDGRRKAPRKPDGPNRFLEQLPTRDDSRKKKPDSGRNKKVEPPISLNPGIAFVLHTDGACIPNPGPASIGAVLRNPQGQVVAELSKSIGNATSNVAEYQAVVDGLKLALDHGVAHLILKLDSKLVADQMRWSYPKSKHLRPLRNEARALARRFDAIDIVHIPRTENADADALAGNALGISPGTNVAIVQTAATFTSPCRWCGYTIARGEIICLMQEGKVWVCEACAKQMASAS